MARKDWMEHIAQHYREQGISEEKIAQIIPWNRWLPDHVKNVHDWWHTNTNPSCQIYHSNTHTHDWL
jgi:hypothetical protein